MINGNVSGTWRRVHTPHVNITSTWRRIIAGWVYTSGVWRKFYAQCPTYFSVPNVSSQSGGRIHSQTGGYYMHNRNLSIPKEYYGYQIINMSATMHGSQSWNEGTGGGWYQMTLGMRLMDSTSGAQTTWSQTWPSSGANIGTYNGLPVYYTYSLGNSVYWAQVEDEYCEQDGPCYVSSYRRNYRSYTMNHTFSPITITGNLNLYYYIISIDDDNNAAGYWENLKLTLKDPHTGTTVALSFA